MEALTIEKLNKLFKRARTLKQYKKYTDDELLKLVKARYESKAKDKLIVKDLDIKNMFVNKDETEDAEKLLKKYVNTYSIETVSERESLKQLIFLEVFNIRLQRELNTCHESQQPSPPKTIEALHSNLNQISALKEKIGLCASKKDKNINEGYAVFETLKKKWKIWREENQGSRTLSCPHCGKMTLLKIRTDIWEALKHPYFKDRVLANDHLMELYKTNKITKNDIALILGTSIDYIDWLVKKIYFKEFGIKQASEIQEENNIKHKEETSSKISFIKSEELIKEELVTTSS